MNELGKDHLSNCEGEFPWVSEKTARKKKGMVIIWPIMADKKNDGTTDSAHADIKTDIGGIERMDIQKFTPLQWSEFFPSGNWQRLSRDEK